MATHDENNVVRMRPQSTLLAGKAAARQPMPEVEQEADGESLPTDDFDSLPLPGSAYLPYARPSNKPEITFHVMLKDGSWRGFAWSNFDSVDMLLPESAGVGPVLVARFGGLVPSELRIGGSNLGKLHALIGRQRIAWIREYPSRRGFDGAAAKDDKAEIITPVAITPWKPDRDE
jgi:hypothetical protein